MASNAPFDPWLLTPADQPGLVLVSQPLSEENYHSWSRAMRMALNGKRKLGFVNGSIERPDPEDNPDLFEQWQCINDIVSSWILNSVSKEIAVSLMYAESAAELWSDLRERFQHGNGPRIFESKRELFMLREGSLTVSQYFTKVKVLWEELNSFRPAVTCDCGGARPLQDFLQSEYVHCFLMGLDDSFSQIRGQILLTEPLPSISKVLALISHEEKQRSVSSLTQAQNQVAFNVQRGFSKGNGDLKSKNGKKDRPLCSHCGILGHTVDKYFKLHGYPPGYGRGKGKQQINNVIEQEHVDEQVN